jgi:hypothetical protein
MLDEIATGDVETTIAEKKRAAYEMISDAMAEAEADGIESGIVTQAALFAVLTDLVSTYGEVQVADFVERLTDRVIAGEFTLHRPLQ